MRIQGDTRLRNNMHDREGTSSQTPLLEDPGEPQESPLETDEASNSESNSVDRATSARFRLRYILSLMMSPFTDEQDSLHSIVVGLLTLTVLGSAVGLALPKNTNLPSPWYQTLSSMMGYSCFCYWSVSFYPQLINNFRRKTTVGLSAEFCALNVLGLACYAVYNLSMFCSAEIQEEYRQRYGAQAEITVQSNDVAFAVHSFLLASITLGQIAFYDGLRQEKLSPAILSAIAIMLTVTIVFPLLILVGICHSWLDYLYMLSFVKIAVTLIKYIPQVILNIHRRSTLGFSIWQILLDLSGGILNDVQLVGDSADMGDWAGITGNPAKLCLGVVSIVFDIVFMTQHYVLYPQPTRVIRAESLDGLTFDNESIEDES